MKRLIAIGTICIITLLLAGNAHPDEVSATVDSQKDAAQGNNFPGQRLYKVESCDRDPGTGDEQCGDFDVGSEFTFAKEVCGDYWRLWLKKPGSFTQVCVGTINGDSFYCEAVCKYTITQLESSKCTIFNHCVSFVQDCPENGPEDGSGKGGHN